MSLTMWRPLLILCVLFTGCGIPQWRIFQRKVSATDSAPPAAQVEGQRRAASYIAKRTAPPVVDASAAVADVHPVAFSLSASLGEPAKPVAVEDREAVIAALSSGLRAKEEQLERWKEFGRKYAGKPLEDTGINLAGPAGLLGLVAVVALCVLVPPVGYLVLRALPLLWGFFRRTTTAIGEFASEHPAAGEQLAVNLGNRMDEAHKNLVRERAGAQRIARKP